MFKRIHYTPAKTVYFEQEVAWHARERYKKPPSEQPIKVTVTFNIVRPKTSKRDIPAVKPDLDNCIKSVCDALNKVVWKDDAQICELHAQKMYTDDSPFITILVEEIPAK